MKFLILLCLAFPLQAVSDTSLWRVSKNDAELYLGGTVHVLSKSDYPLPEQFNQAYKQAQMLVLETDLNAMNKPEIQSRFTKRFMYPQGQSLKTHLKPATYQALADYIKSHKMQISAFQQFKPTLVMLNLTVTELKRLDLADAGVDDFFNKKALADGKSLGELEDIGKQLDVLENMGTGHEDEMILSTLDDLKKLSSMMTELKVAWRSGDLKQLEILGIIPLANEYPALYKMVLVDRNLSWLPKIEAFLDTPETELILIGALHLAGKDGLLAQLQQRGYKVEAF